MKKYVFSLMVSAMLLIAAGCNSGNTNKSSDMQSPAETEIADNQKYTCPMHPEVVSDQPGDCPKCGMSLEKIEMDADTTHSVTGDTI